MRINSQKNNQNFKGLYNNKFVLKSLEKISDHSASFSAGVSLVSALTIRPLAISFTPKTKKEDKKIFSADSFASALSKFVVVEAIALPIERAIKKINAEPKKFLNKNTIESLSLKSKSLANSREYKFITQGIKMGSNLISALPKSMLGVALIPVISDFLFKRKEKKDDILLDNKEMQKPLSFSQFKASTSFKGLPKIVGKIIDNDDVRKLAKKYVEKDKNIARNLSVATDLLLTSTSVVGIANSKKIERNKKKPLILNKLFSTTLSIVAGCSLDKLIQKGTEKTIKNFTQVNKNSPKLLKYIDGINVLRPTMVFALVYYGLIPIISAYGASKISGENKA